MQQHFDSESGDTSAPSERELSARAEEEARRDRDLVQRGRVIQRGQTIEAARRLARQDRREDRLLGR
jgi:hypothetical protein